MLPTSSPLISNPKVKRQPTPWFIYALGAIILLALLGELLGHGASQIDVNAPLSLPSFSHLLGTDEMGRDLLARLSLGAKVSLSVGILAALFSVAIGAAYGAISGLANKAMDSLLMQGLDILYSLPFLMVVVLFSLVLNQALSGLTQWAWLVSSANVIALVLALAFFSWPDTARMTRGMVLKIKQELFIEAAQSLGVSKTRLLMKHIIPNLLPVLLMSLTIALPRAILTEATLSFIGLGINPPWCSWGTMIGDGWQMVRSAPHLLIFPAGLLVLTVLAFNTAAKQFR